MNFMKRWFRFALMALLLVPCACTEEESDLGVGLQDPFTFYSGIRDTAYVTACTLYDDSLATAGLATGIFGNYSDAIFGSVEAVFYSQVSTPSDGVRITDAVQIDSVVLTLVIDTILIEPNGEKDFKGMIKGVLNDTIAVEYDLKLTDNGEDYDVEWERME